MMTILSISTSTRFKTLQHLNIITNDSVIISIKFNF